MYSTHFCILIEDRVLFGPEPTRRQAVHGDSRRPPLVCQTHGQLFDSSPAGAIGGDSCGSKHTGDRTDIDDAPVASLHHRPRERLRDKKCSLQVGIEHQIPIVRRNLQRRLPHVAAGVVHQDVDLAEVAPCAFGRPPDPVNISDIQFERQYLSPDPLNLVLK